MKRVKLLAQHSLTCSKSACMSSRASIASVLIWLVVVCRLTTRIGCIYCSDYERHAFIAYVLSRLARPPSVNQEAIYHCIVLQRSIRRVCCPETRESVSWEVFLYSNIGNSIGA